MGTTRSTLRRLLALIAKELRMVLADPKSRYVLIVPPIIQFLVFGYAATFDLSAIRFALLDESRTTESRELVARFTSSDTFELQEVLLDAQRVDDLLDADRVRMVLRIGERFAEDLAAGRAADVQVIVDGRNSNVAGIAGGYIAQIVEAYNRDHGFTAGRPVLVERAWFNPNFSSRWFIVSCLGGVIATVVVMLLSSLSVAREREFGTFDQLLVTPLTPPLILVGKATPPILFGTAISGLLSVGAVLWYGVPFEGSVVGALAVLVVYMLSVAGVGLFVSSLATTMQQGMLGSFVFIMPAVLLSGFTTPIENMPTWLQTATLANPMRWVATALRRVFLEGDGLRDLAPTLLPLGLIALVTLSAAGWLFRRRVA